MEKILLTGSNGFVGSNLAEHLHKKYLLVGIGRGEKRKNNVQEYIKADISEDLLHLKNILKNCKCIIHAAADKAKHDFSDSLINVNCIGTYQIAKLAKELNCQKVIYISSIPVIGSPPKEKIREDYMPVPNTMYHTTKLSGEYIMQQLVKENINVITLRIPSPIGYEMPLNTIFPIFIQKALLNQKIEILGRGGRRQNYVDLRDVADVINTCIQSNIESGCYNIAAEKSISNIELAEKCVFYLNSSSDIEFSNKPDKLEDQIWDISIEKAKKYLHYEPKYDVSQMIEYYGNQMKFSIF